MIWLGIQTWIGILILLGILIWLGIVLFWMISFFKHLILTYFCSKIDWVNHRETLQKLSWILWILLRERCIFVTFLLANIDFKPVFVILLTIFIGLLKVLCSLRILDVEGRLFGEILNFSDTNLFLDWIFSREISFKHVHISFISCFDGVRFLHQCLY